MAARTGRQGRWVQAGWRFVATVLALGFGLGLHGAAAQTLSPAPFGSCWPVRPQTAAPSPKNLWSGHRAASPTDPIGYPRDFVGGYTVVNTQAYLHYGWVPDGPDVPGAEVSISVSASLAAELVLVFDDGAGLVPDSQETGVVSGALRGLGEATGWGAAGQAFDARVTVSRDGAAFGGPDRITTEPLAFWYRLAAGTHSVRVRLQPLPTVAQAPGNYHFRPKLRLEPAVSGASRQAALPTREQHVPYAAAGGRPYGGSRPAGSDWGALAVDCGEPNIGAEAHA